MFLSYNNFNPVFVSVLSCGYTSSRASSRSRKFWSKTLLLSIHSNLEYSMLYKAVWKRPSWLPKLVHSRQPDELELGGAVTFRPAIRPLPNILQLVLSFFANKLSWHYVVMLVELLL